MKSIYTTIIIASVWIVFGFGISTAQNKSVAFDGSHSIANDLSVVQSFATNSSFTVQFWAKRAANAAGYIIGQGTNAVDKGLHIGFRSASVFTFAFYGDDLDSDPITYDSKWHHYAVTYNSTTKARKIYMDGVLIKSGTASANYSGTGNVLIGNGVVSSYFNGSIDELALFNSEQSQSDIQVSLGGIVYPWSAGLVSFLDFSTNGSTYTYDSKVGNYIYFTSGDLAIENPSSLTLGQPTFTLLPINHNFGSVNIGNSPSSTFYVKNTGLGILDVNSVSSNNAKFTISSTTAKAIFAGDSAQYIVTFTPIATGIQSGNITFTHNASGSPSNFAVAGLTSVPSFTSFTPRTGTIGSTITITGTNFSTTPANNVVHIGGIPAVVQTATSTQLTVKVPRGVCAGPLTIETGGYVLQSKYSFVPTFTSNNTLTSTTFHDGITSFVQIDQSSGTRNDIISMDVDRDGKPDLVVAGSNSIGIFRNIHAGGMFTTGSYDTRVDISLGFSPGKLTVADIDGDGVEDIVAGGGSTIAILRNTSTVGSFSFSTTTLSPGTSSSTFDAAVGDIDGDGKQDIVCAGYLGAPTYDYRLLTYRNTSSSGSVSFSSAVLTSFTHTSTTTAIAAADLDGDGYTDVAVIQGGSIPADIIISVFRSTGVPGSVSYATAQTYSMPPDYNYAKYITTADLNDDGLPELLCGDASSTMSIFPNTSSAGTVSFGTRQDYSSIDARGTTPEISVADVTGDGKTDVIASAPYDSYVKVFPNTSSGGSVSLGTAVQYANQISGTFWDIGGHVVVDGNLDGKPDIITASSNSIGLWDNKIVSPQFLASSYNYSMGTLPVGIYKKDSINVSNSGGQTLTISSVISTNSTDFSVTPASATISTGSNQWFVINYHYDGSGTRTTKLVFSHNAASVTDTVSVSATSSFSAQVNAGNCVALSGTNQYVESDIVTTAVDNVTMEAWVNWGGQASGSPGILYHGNSSNSGYGIVLYESATPARSLTILCGGKGWVTSSTQLPTNSWHHIAAVRESGTWKLYLDGIERSLTNASVVPNTPVGKLDIGSVSVGTQVFKGKIDELRIWNVARTQAQIRASYQSQAGNETGLAGYYRLDEGIGTATGDGSGHGKSAMLMNSASWSASAAPVGTPAYSVSSSSVSLGYIADGSSKTDSVTISNTGSGVLNITPSSNNLKLTFSPAALAIVSGENAKLFVTFSPQTGSDSSGTITLTHNAAGSPNTISVNHLTGASFAKATSAGNMLVFNGNDNSDFVSTTYSSALNPAGSFTYEAWARSDVQEYSYSGYVISAGDYYSGVRIGPGNSGWSAYIGTGGTAMSLYASGKTQSAWYHLAVTYSGTTAKFYVNGELKQTLSGTYNRNVSFPFYLGTESSSPWYSGFTGAIDEVRVWSVARTQEEIRADMTNSLNGNETGLVSYWRLDEGTGTTVQDISLSGRNLTLGSGDYVPAWQVSAAGFPAPYLNNYTSSLSFGNVQTGQTKKDSFYVKNVGATSLSISSVTSDNTKYTISPTSATIASNDSGKIIVTFAPTVLQTENGTITLAHNAFGSPNTVTVSGAGATANFSASPTGIAFGSVQVGTAKTDSITISNSGGISLRIDSVKGPNSNYSITPTSATVASGGNQKFYVTFNAAPPSGSSNGNISFYHSAGGSPSSVSATATKVFQAASNAGNGLTFNKTSKFVDIAPNALLTTTNFTVELWMKIGETWQWNGVIDKGRNTGNNWYILTTNSGSGESQGLKFGMQGSAEGTVIWGDNKWHHVAMTFDGTNRKMYVDGDLKQTQSVTAYSPVTSNIRIGGRQDTSSQTLNPFDGNIDEVRIWNVARTQSQIQSSYGSLAGNETGLVAYLRFDESSGTTAYDATGNGLDGTLYNGLARQAPSTAPVGVPVYAASATSKNFGNIYFSKSKQDSVIIRNTGNGVLNITNIASSDTQFTFTPATFTILSGDSAKLYITATPVSLGTKNATISLTHNATGSPSTISVQAKAIVPVITGFSPASGTAGTAVVISGSGFNSTAANNIVYFGTTKGIVTSSTDTTITVTVPAGATYAPITVTTNNLTAYSRNGFILKFTTSNQIAAGSFAANATVPATANGYGLTIADIDGDGKPDLVTGNENSNGMSVIRNTSSPGTFSFAAPTNFSTSPSSGLDVAVGDIDGDGKLDVVATNANTGWFYIFRNTSTSGSISFATRLDYGATGAHGVALGDLDGDGKADLIVTSNSGTCFWAFKNNSVPGSISITAVNTLVTASGPREAHLIDFDGDGKLDVAVDCYGPQFSVFRNTSTLGNITFSGRQNYTADYPFGLAVGDLTGDGKPDIVAGATSVATVFQNTSSPGTISFNTGVNFSASSYRTVTIADFSGDGKPDIATNSSASAVSVLKNTFTSGTLNGSSFAAKVDYAIGASTWNLRSADLDGDGKVDLAAIGTASSSNTVSLLRNTVPLPATFLANKDSVPFGNVNLGANKVDSVFIKNSGGVALSVTTVSATDTQFVVTPITATVAVGDSQKFTITFTPTASAAVNAKIIFSDNTPAGSDTIFVGGTGIGSVYAASPLSKNFGNLPVGGNKEDSVAISNSGNDTLRVTGIISSSAEFTFSPSTLNVAPAGSKKLYLTFSPASTGNKNADIILTHNAQTTPDTILVSGKGIQPIFSVNNSSLSFGNAAIGLSKQDSVTVSNTGTDTLTISSVTSSNARFTVAPTNAAIAPSSSAKFYVSFLPTASGAQSGSVVFTHNALSAPDTVDVSGTGAFLAASASGNAVDLNGSNQYVDIADAVWFNGSFTVESWVFVRAVANYTRLFDFGNGSGSNNILCAASTGTTGQVSLHVFQGTASQMIQASSVLSLNKWNHIACVLNGTSATIYVNGEVAASGSLWAPLNVTRTSNYIGKSNWPSDPNTNMKVDEFRIWNVARTQTEIQSDMNGSLAGNESGLIGYWRMDEPSGTTLIDATGSGKAGTILNSAPRVSSTVPLPAPNFFASKSSLSFSNIAIGSSAKDTVYVRNRGTAALQIDSVKSSGSEFTISPISAAVNASDSARFVVTFSPVSSGAKNSTFTFYDNSFTSPNTFSASGSAISTEPATPDSNLTASHAYPYKVTLTWKRGDADSHLVVMNAVNIVDGNPADGSSYSANTAFGSGAQIGSGNFVAYNGSGDSVVITNLEGGETYYASVFGYNGGGTVSNYRTPSAAVDSFTIPYAENSPLPGTALSFNGTNNSVAVNALTNLSGDSLTIEYWFKGNNLQSAVRQQNGGSYIVAGWNNSGTKVHILSNDGTQTSGLPVGASAEDGNWHHIALTWKRNTTDGFKTYLDGNIVAQRNSSNTPISNMNVATYFGSFGGTGEFTNGMLDEIRIWKAERSTEQIREYMHRRLSGVQQGLVAYFQFNEGSGSTATDSIHGYVGTLNNSPAWQTSTVPFGAGTSTTVSSFQSGTAGCSDLTLITTEQFDEPVALVYTKIPALPNRLPEGYSSLVGNGYCILSAFGNAGTFSTQMKFTFGSSILDSRDDMFPSGVRLFRRESNSDGAWTEIGSADSAKSEAGEVWFSGVTSFSQFAVVEDEQLLPVELTSFTAASVRLNAELKWKTATEVNNYGFDVERKSLSTVSLTGKGTKGWSRVGFVEGAGISNSPKEYSFLDKNLRAGTYAYRLKQIDKEGKFIYTYSVELEIGAAPLQFQLSQNYPNPFNPMTTIEFTLAEDGLTTLKVFDLLGREVASLLNNEVMKAGMYHQVFFNGARFASGIYFARLESNGKYLLKKMLLVK